MFAGYFKDMRPQISHEFQSELDKTAKRLGCDSTHLLMTFYVESKLNPRYRTTHNKASSAGMIAITSTDAKMLGTTVARIATMSQEQQTILIGRLIEPFTGKLTSFVDVYLACFYPDAVGMGKEYYFRFPAKYKKANDILPLRNNNRIQKWEVEKTLYDYFMRLGW